jgi:hypothetical protein
MRKFSLLIPAALALGACAALLAAQRQAPSPGAEPADLLLLNARVWTGEASMPRAAGVAARGERIVFVGSAQQARRLIAPGRTRVLDLAGRLVLPGFIDNHVHFAQAGLLLLGLNLLDVNDAENLRRRVSQAAARLPAGAWLTGGDWGAYAEWEQHSAGAPARPAGPAPRPEFRPDRKIIDSVSGQHPAFIRRFDGAMHLANSLALAAAGITRDTPDPPGGEIVRDAAGEPTGLLIGAAAHLVAKVIPPPGYAQRRAEALRALEEARRFGVTTVHDNVASFDQLQLLYDLKSSGLLTARVWARMWLSEWEKVRDYARENNLPVVPGGWGDDFIRLGGLKAWVDGIMGNSTALFLEPYSNNPASSGRLRDVMFPEGNLFRLMKAADAAGFTITVHAIGDRANRILLDTFQQVLAENPARERRHRVVHAQVLAPEDLPRFAALKLVAEVQPYHAIDDMRWMEERIGARARNAYRFRSLAARAATLSFGSDWPGTNASLYPINPLLGIYAAVTRQTMRGEPPGGWFPDERLGLEEAVRAFTVNNAWTTWEEKSKGSIREGKLGDLVVLDRDIFSRPPRELLDTRVLYTILGGRIVYQAPAAEN